MGSFTKFMASAIFFIILSFFLVPTRTQEEGFISVVISSKGLEFSKDLLIEQAVSSIIPLQLPQIEKSVKIPLVGQVHVVLSNITIYNVDIASSYVETGDSGIALIASGATANLSMDWWYSYSSWLFDISDNVDASVQENHASCSPDIMINKLAGTIKLNHVTAYLKSKIGNLHMHLVKAVLSTILKTVVVPYVNLHLWKGLP